MIDIQFPKISARNLDGGAVEIPDDLGGKANLVVLAFAREHQNPIESWLPHLAGLEAEYPGLGVWQVPALSRRYRMWRGAIDSGMRAGISDPRARSHTLTAYLDLNDLQRSLGLSDLADIRLYLLDGAGRVRWEGSGGYDAGTLVSIEAALANLLGGV